MGYAIIETETLTPATFPGVEVVAKVASTFEEFTQIQRLSILGGNVEDASAMDAALVEFASKFIESWNLTDSSDNPIPTSEIHRIPLPLKVAIVAEWMRLIRTPPGPLGQESSSGLDSREEPTSEPASE